MKKVGILTFHYADNYGAVLQAWALRKVLNNMPNITADIINYVPEGYCIYPYLSSEDGIEQMKHKRAKFEEFLLSEGMVTKSIQHTVSGNEYDYYITGSDQVWNLSFRENITKEYLFPNLDSAAKRISYAASVGDEIEEQDKEIFQKYLSNFNAISVREEKCAKQLLDLGFKGVQTVLDPTLLLNTKDYETLIEEPVDRPENFLFFFTYPIGDEIRKWIPFVNTMARNNNLEVIHTAVNIPKEVFSSKNETVMYSGIGEFLWYVKNAKAIVTTSYHGAIFGRLFERPTYVIKRATGWRRLEQLNKVLGIDDKVIDEDWIKKDWKIDKYRAIDGLSLWRKQSIDYLCSALGEGKN